MRASWKNCIYLLTTLNIISKCSPYSPSIEHITLSASPVTTAQALLYSQKLNPPMQSHLYVLQPRFIPSVDIPMPNKVV